MGLGLGFGLAAGALAPILPNIDILDAPSVPIDCSIFIPISSASPWIPPLNIFTLRPPLAAFLAARTALPGLACCTACACRICGPTLDILGVAPCGGAGYPDGGADRIADTGFWYGP